MSPESEWRFTFLSFATAAVIALLLFEATRTWIIFPETWNFWGIMMVVGVFVTLEWYYENSRFHRHHRVPYGDFYLFFDLVQGIAFTGAIVGLALSFQLCFNLLKIESPLATLGLNTTWVGTLKTGLNLMAVAFSARCARIASVYVFSDIRLNPENQKTDPPRQLLSENAAIFWVPLIANAAGVALAWWMLDSIAVFEAEKTAQDFAALCKLLTNKAWLGAVCFLFYCLRRWITIKQ